MEIDKYDVLRALPPFRDEWVLVKDDQTVSDIITEMMTAHNAFRNDYDRIYQLFDRDTVKELADELYRFCSTNIAYVEESEDLQTTSVPAGILLRGFGDCKSFAGVCGGVISAVKRNTGKSLTWYYCFASYLLNERTPYHVFVVLEDVDGRPIWIDPTPGSAGTIPVWVINKYID